ncbi:MAG: transposase [Candidatus Peribacteraceae bacterium]|nr:transposase [Candidatus Peribacteraceae bacterium]
MKGLSIRTLAHHISKGLDRTYARIVEELKHLPSNNDVTSWYCNRKRFCGALVVDGKYVKVKGYDRKIPFLFGMDYSTHDLPICLLTRSESFEAWKQFFTKLKNMDYPLVSVTCDDNPAIAQAVKYVFPNIIVQVCHVHFLENIRKTLRVRTDETYRLFFKDIETHIFRIPILGKASLERHIRWRSPRHQDDSVKIAVLNHIFTHAEALTAYVDARNKYKTSCPKTTNIIESLNSQLEGRLKTIQGFQSFQSAERWLSAWILRKRFTPFTDCRKPFKKLNGTYSLEHTRRGKVKIPKLF